MIFSNTIFSQIASKIDRIELFEKIIQAQGVKFDIRPYKIDRTFPANAKKIYDNLQSKYDFALCRYEISKELTVQPNYWHQNERRIFVWFLVFYCYFNVSQSESLVTILLMQTNSDFTKFSIIFFHKNPDFLEFQYLNLLKVKERISWTQEEDNILKEAVNNEKAGKWNEISKRIYYETHKKLFRSPKHCRERWLNHLDSNKVKGSWSPAQDSQIFEFVLQHGKKWSKIVAQLKNTRTEHMIKNRFNSLISKFKSQKKQKEEEIIKKVIKISKKSIQNQQNQKTNEQMPLKQASPINTLEGSDQIDIQQSDKNNKCLETVGKSSDQNLANSFQEIYSNINNQDYFVNASNYFFYYQPSLESFRNQAGNYFQFPYPLMVPDISETLVIQNPQIKIEKQCRVKFNCQFNNQEPRFAGYIANYATF